jgi:putative DNA primase/helicase
VPSEHTKGARTPTLEDALAIARRGGCVVPLWLADPTSHTGCSCPDPKPHKAGKHPKSKAGAAGSTDSSVIGKWWRAGANLGINLGNSDLVDIAPDSLEALEEFERLGLPETANFDSGSGTGHRHYLYRRPSHCPKHRVCRSDQYDIMSDGIAVLPPSESSKGAYTWRHELPKRIQDLPFAPEWAVARLVEAAGSRGAKRIHWTELDDGTGFLLEHVKFSPQQRRWWQGENFTQRADGSVDRSESLYFLGKLLASAGVGFAARVEALAERDRTLGWNKYSDRADGGQAEYRRIAEKTAKEAALDDSGSLHVPGELPDTPINERFHLTDAGNAELFAHLYRDRLRYDHRRGRWLVWASHWWREDVIQAVVQLAIEAARSRIRAAADIADGDFRRKVLAWATTSESRRSIDACLALAPAMPAIADDGDGWDADPFLLGVENGVVDLRTGELRAGRLEDRITKHAPSRFNPSAPSPTFDAFLERVQPDAEMRSYLQRRAGYSLTADVTEQDLLFLHGGGANGKTTFANALMDAMGGDYAIQAAPGLLLQTRGDRHPTELADLDGARLVVSTEVQDGRALAEDLVKQLTGGDRLKARRMRMDFYSFELTCKLLLLANHKPTIKGTDWAIWRRVKLVPWNETISPSGRDPHLREKLRAEGPGILAWAVRGCLDWRQNGMQEPPGVSAATEAYRADSDVLGDFLEDCCALGEQYTVPAGALYGAYRSWAADAGIGERDQLTQTAFGKRVGERFEAARIGNKQTRSYRGLGLLSEHEGSFTAEKADAFGQKQTSWESRLPESRLVVREDALRKTNPENASVASAASTGAPIHDDDWIGQPEAVQ